MTAVLQDPVGLTWLPLALSKNSLPHFTPNGHWVAPAPGDTKLPHPPPGAAVAPADRSTDADFSHGLD